jgi:hypothetical protein
MWILKWLPDWIFYAALVVGVIGLISTYLVKFLAKFIPPIYVYKTPIQLISIALIILGVFMSGAIYNNDQWEARVKELEEKVKVAEEQSKEVNKEVEIRVVERTKVVKEKGKTQIEYINRLVKGDTVEVIKEVTKDMSEEERQAFLVKQKELQDAIKNCPIPKIIIEEHNKAAQPK